MIETLKSCQHLKLIMLFVAGVYLVKVREPIGHFRMFCNKIVNAKCFPLLLACFGMLTFLFLWDKVI